MENQEKELSDFRYCLEPYQFCSAYGTSIKTKYDWKKQIIYISQMWQFRSKRNNPTPSSTRNLLSSDAHYFLEYVFKIIHPLSTIKKYICLLDFLLKTCALNNSPSPRLLKFVFVGYVGCVGCAGQIVAWIACDRVGL